MKSWPFLPTVEHRALLIYIVNAVMLFMLSLGVALMALLLFIRVPLVNTDPFYVNLGTLWLVAASTFIGALVVIGFFWYRARHVPGHHWSRADRRLGLVLTAFGLTCGLTLFLLRYATVQAQVSVALTQQFLQAMSQSGLSVNASADERLTFDDRGHILWATGSGQCPRARVQWERLDASWEAQKSGGMMTAGVLEATLLRALWLHGCFDDPAYLDARQGLTQRAHQAQQRLSYEAWLPVLALHWPVQSWAKRRKALFDRIPVTRKGWCEDRDARDGLTDVALTHHCAQTPWPQKGLSLPARAASLPLRPA